YSRLNLSRVASPFWSVTSKNPSTASRGYLTLHPVFHLRSASRVPGFNPSGARPNLPITSRMNAQTPASALNDPEHWRQRSEEARRMANLMSDIPSKEAMLRIADD